MIKPSMNKIEVNSEIRNDVQMKNRKVAAFVHDFHKAIKRMPRGMFCRTMRMHVDVSRQDYIVAAAANKGVVCDAVFAIVEHGRNTWYYKAQTDIMDTMDIYSRHFFQRFAERTGRTFEIERTIAEYIQQNASSVMCYIDESSGDTVYASSEGIELCRWDRERGVTKHCTFVSLDMLKDTQMEAFEKVVHKVEEGKRGLANRRGASIERQLRELRDWSASCDSAKAEASRIYAQYWEN